MPLTRVAAVTKGALMTYLAPKLAQDAVIDIHPLIKGLSRKNFGTKRNELLGGITNLVKDKLAKDAELDHLPELLEALEKEEEEEEGEEEGLDEGTQTGASSAVPSAAHEFLQGKLSSEDMATYDALSKDEVKPGVDPNDRTKGEGTNMDEEEDEEELKKKEAKDAEERIENLEKEHAKDKRAMDAKIASAIREEQQRQKDIREAEKAFRPYLGEIAMSFDSAEDVYRHGLKALGIRTKLDNVPLTALRAILESQPSPNARKAEQREIAMDAHAVDGFKSRFKNAVQPKQL